MSRARVTRRARVGDRAHRGRRQYSLTKHSSLQYTLPIPASNPLVEQCPSAMGRSGGNDQVGGCTLRVQSSGQQIRS